MKRQLSKLVFTSIVYTIITFVMLLYLVPVFWILLSSFKPEGLFLTPNITGFSPTLGTYERLLEGTQFLGIVLNSIVVSSSASILSILIGLLPAYALARSRTDASRNTSTWIISTRMAPPFAIGLPFYFMVSSLHLLDTHIALITIYLTFNLPFAIWMLMLYFRELPLEIEEAATVDGASRLQTLVKIILPISKPAIIGVAIVSFWLSWNEFLFAFLLTSHVARTIPPYIASLVGVTQLDWPSMTAIATIAIVPAFVINIFAQKHLVKGLTLGATK